MKRTIFAGVTAGALLLSLMPGLSTAAQDIDKIVAVVGEGVVLESELDRAVERIQRRLGAEAEQIPPTVLRSQVLDQLILTHLQTQRAAEAGLQVSDRELNQAVERLAQQNGMTMPEFLAALRNDGLQPDELRDHLREEMLINKLQEEEVVGRVVVTQQDVDRYLESEALRVQEDREYRIRHILVEVAESAGPETVRAARNRIESLRERAVSGEEAFGDLAITHSDGKNALEGGDLGWLAGGFLPSLFSEVVPKLQAGEVSPVFRGGSGFHLIELAGVRDAPDQPAAETATVVEEVQARHILLKTNEIRNQERAQEQIAELRERILAGGDFADLAREYSDDSASANQGGDLGWIRSRQMPPQFGTQLQDLEAGDISQPFETAEGWHIVQVQDRRERDLSEERQRNRARQAIGRRKIEEETETWIQRLRDEAYVEIRMEDYQGG